MNNFLTFLMTKKGVLTVCASVSAVAFGSYRFNEYVYDRSVFESLNIQFVENARTADGVEQLSVIEYGDTDFDLTTLIASSTGDVTLPVLDVTKVGEQTLTFKVSMDGQEREFTKVVKVQDTQAPKITLASERVTLSFNEEYDVSSLVESVSDPVDGAIARKSEETAQSYYEIEGSIDTTTPGEYVITVKAVDKNGNESSASATIIVKEKEKTAAELAEEHARKMAGTQVPAYSGGNTVADAAMAQLGVAQDCTSLVTKALAAVGIHYHGSPAGYLSLGTVVSAADALPGDIIYYADGGVGTAHVAVYIGNGQAVHGGWKGTTTVASAYVGSGPVFIRLN